MSATANLEGVLDEIAAKCENDSTPDTLTLEEIFIYELGGADYAVKDILL